MPSAGTARRALSRPGDAAPGRRGRRRSRSAVALAVGLLGLVLLSLAAACRPEPPPAEPAADDRPLLVLCERDEQVVGDLLAAWSAATGTEVEVRYGAPGELATALAEGAPPERPTVYLSRHAAGLGALAAAGRALHLPADLLAPLDPQFVDPERRWAGLTGRARAVVYDARRLSREELPADLAGFGDPKQRGRFGIAPGSRSFRVHLAAYRALHGPEALARLLERIAANEPTLAADGEALVRAVLDHELDFALVDHPDLWRVRAERGHLATASAAGAGTAAEDADESAVKGAGDEAPDDPAAAPDAAPAAEPPGALLALPAADSSGFLDLAGVAVLAESPAALALVRHLLSPAAQAALAAATFEYPLVPGVEPTVPLVPLAELDLAQVDYGAVAAALPETTEAVAQIFLP
jgi:iron(III) transport system substrate-binding protein